LERAAQKQIVRASWRADACLARLEEEKQLCEAQRWKDRICWAAGAGLEIVAAIPYLAFGMRCLSLTLGFLTCLLLATVLARRAQRKRTLRALEADAKAAARVVSLLRHRLEEKKARILQIFDP
jgi:hypothetical protein